MKGEIIIIYLDHASTTPICNAAKNVMMTYINDFGNPSSQHELGRQARVLVEDARERIAKCINAEPNEIYFTSGGSEANTWALLRRSFIRSSIEHHSAFSFFSTQVPVEQNGFVDPNAIEIILRRYKDTPRVSLVSCIAINNEIGIKNNIGGIAKLAHKYNKLFHTDAVQAIGHIPIDVKCIDCDTLSASGHKFGSPKGVGFLYVKNGTRIDPLIQGGKQESGLRGGTENVLGIISMAAALEDAVEHMEERNKHIKYLRDKLLNKLLLIPGSNLNGSLADRVPSNINIRFDGISGSRLVAMCDLLGVCISAGSACNEGNPQPSHVLKAIGLSDEEALSSVRITIGHENTEEEIDISANVITNLVERTRSDEH